MLGKSIFVCIWRPTRRDYSRYPILLLTLLFLVSTVPHGNIPALFLLQIFLASTWCDELLISAELVGARVHEAHNAIEDDHMFI